MSSIDSRLRTAEAEPAAQRPVGLVYSSTSDKKVLDPVVLRANKTRQATSTGARLLQTLDITFRNRVKLI